MIQALLVDNQDGTGEYRGWRLEKRLCDSPGCNCNLLCWFAYHPYEMDLEGMRQCELAGGIRKTEGIGYLQRAVGGEGYDKFWMDNTIEELIDSFERGREHVLSQAVLTWRLEE